MGKTTSTLTNHPPSRPLLTATCAFLACLVSACGGGGDASDQAGWAAGQTMAVDADGRKATLDAASLGLAAALTEDQALRYIASHADLIEAFGQDTAAASAHFAGSGQAEGRTITFDPLQYVAANPDLISPIGTDSTAAARHYIRFGYREGRSTRFDTMRYIASHGDLINAFGTNTEAAVVHYVRSGFAEGRTLTFDALRYIASHLDLIGSFGVDTDGATRHYVANGWREGRAVSFNAAGYLANYTDLAQVFGNDTVGATRHYILYGVVEGRTDLRWQGIREGGAAGSSSDVAYAVATDQDGNVIIGGRTEGTLAGDVAGRTSDAYVTKYAAAGGLSWSRKLQTSPSSNNDSVNGVATDSDGNIYAVGGVTGTLAGQIQAGSGNDADVAVLKYDRNGNLLWARQFGSAQDDTGLGIALDNNGGVFVVGQTAGQLPTQPAGRGVDLFIAKFDTSGNRLWIRQSGSSGGDSARGVAVDLAGNAYMTGWVDTGYQDQSNPNLFEDAFVAKYDTNGNQLWFSRILGQYYDYGRAITVSDDGNIIYLAGSTHTNFELAGYPRDPRSCCVYPTAFVARMNGAGTVQWIHNLQSAIGPGPTYFADGAYGVTTDAAGSAVFLTGYTAGVLPGAVSQGAQDIFVARYESTGTRSWVHQFGGAIPASGTRNDIGYGITLDKYGDVFVAGSAHGSFGTPNPSNANPDWFVMKLKPADGSVY